MNEHKSDDTVKRYRKKNRMTDAEKRLRLPMGKCRSGQKVRIAADVRKAYKITPPKVDMRKRKAMDEAEIERLSEALIYQVLGKPNDQD